MSTPQRRQPVDLISRLLAEPHRFGFFQAVRRLNQWFVRRDDDGSTATDALTPRLRFRNALSLGFPASEIAALELVGGHEPSAAPGSEHAIDAIDITPAFTGLLGAGGALPIFYTEMLAEREIYHRDKAARAFLDIFQQRSVTMFYQAWRKHRLPVRYEDDRVNQFLPMVLAIAGVGQSALRNRLHGSESGVCDDTIAYFSGLLQQRPVSAHSIEQLVSKYFAVPAQIEQFVGRWFDLPPESGSALGAANATLGADAVVGERVWQRDLRMRLTLGPMRRDKLRRFLPGGAAARPLRDLLSMLTGMTIEYELRLALSADEVQGTTLENGPAGACLGWDSFLVTGRATDDRSDAGYDIHALH